eukprot:CAMPEP_0185035042 /NCGR_PEP_ID=MMETSP1103-20130426/25722_1 /TAXON_ID=36769 /ORGANISM="Paraphysomonas bandaiensis, Strain Caron Lab Isolate" /LENGTH=273 /DNA_ID=CAMNT_0027571951 /DNA_START=251 /DNA_END=1072 /DNA_ORIENTATION=-
MNEHARQYSLEEHRHRAQSKLKSRLQHRTNFSSGGHPQQPLQDVGDSSDYSISGKQDDNDTWKTSHGIKKTFVSNTARHRVSLLITREKQRERLLRKLEEKRNKLPSAIEDSSGIAMPGSPGVIGDTGRHSPEISSELYSAKSIVEYMKYLTYQQWGEENDVNYDLSDSGSSCSSTTYKSPTDKDKNIPRLARILKRDGNMKKLLLVDTTPDLSPVRVNISPEHRMPLDVHKTILQSKLEQMALDRYTQANEIPFSPMEEEIRYEISESGESD